MNEIMIASANTDERVYCSMRAETVEQKKLLYNATASPNYRLKDFINQIVKIKDLYMEMVQVADEDGTVSDVPRCILIDVDNMTYAATSYGIYNAICRLVKVFGQPTWENGVAVKVKQVTLGKDKNILTFEAV